MANNNSCQVIPAYFFSHKRVLSFTSTYMSSISIHHDVFCWPPFLSQMSNVWSVPAAPSVFHDHSGPICPNMTTSSLPHMSVPTGPVPSYCPGQKHFYSAFLIFPVWGILLPGGGISGCGESPCIYSSRLNYEATNMPPRRRPYSQM